MRLRRFAGIRIVGVTGIALLWLASPLAAQTAATTPTAGPAEAKAYKAPRTPDGQPNLQGVWDFRSLTPLERPAELAGRDVLSAEEAAAFEKKRLTEIANLDNEVPADIVGNYNQFWFDRGSTVVETKRTSLIVDPADGRIPPMTPEARKREDAIGEARRGVGMHEPTRGGWVEELGPNGLQVRCIVGFNSGPPMAPGGYNNNVQIVQVPGYVVLVNEMNHNARIVPLDGRPFVGVRRWVGESRGRWQGETLVVETKHFLRETSFNRGRTTKSLHLIERFTRVDPDTLLYEFTVDDPTVWTRPWTAQVTMTKSDQHIYEYACHEGNVGLVNILAGARAKEKDNVAAKKE
jgi:hypothetical protein